MRCVLRTIGVQAGHEAEELSSHKGHYTFLAFLNKVRPYKGQEGTIQYGKSWIMIAGYGREGFGAVKS